MSQGAPEHPQNHRLLTFLLFANRNGMVRPIDKTLLDYTLMCVAQQSQSQTEQETPSLGPALTVLEGAMYAVGVGCEGAGVSVGLWGRHQWPLQSARVSVNSHTPTHIQAALTGGSGL